MKIAVIGAGSWGTTISALLAENGHDVKLWAREKEVVDSINSARINPYFVQDLLIPSKVIAQNDLAQVLDKVDIAVLAIPSTFLKLTLAPFKDELKKCRAIVNVAKGFEPTTGKRLSSVICELIEVTPESSDDIVACVSGPNIAAEVARKKIGATVVACPNETIAKELQRCFSNDYFRVYRQKDRTGAELGGTLKNIFAIGSGILTGLELGDNAKATYLTRSLHELVRLGTVLGGEKQTFYGLAGLGDLVVTTSSPLSRNFKLGMAIAAGATLNEYLASTKMVVEGVEATKHAYEWSKKLGVELPITEELFGVLFEGSSPREGVKNLMKRGLKDEID